jgi:hypothetical protein
LLFEPCLCNGGVGSQSCDCDADGSMSNSQPSRPGDSWKNSVKQEDAVFASYFVVGVRVDVAHAVAVVHVGLDLTVVRYRRDGAVGTVFPFHVVLVGLYQAKRNNVNYQQLHCTILITSGIGDRTECNSSCPNSLWRMGCNHL